MSDLTNDLLAAVVVATPERKAEALKVLRGEAAAGPATPARPASLRLMTMGQAAEAMGVSRPTLWRLIKAGRIRTVELRRGSRRVPEVELIRFMEGREGPGDCVSGND